jgi:D-alanyl-D-alanine carboxypeptidase/D-alanyl-D-alanine-endopeptidase (penicillin-binding protein 4)
MGRIFLIPHFLEEGILSLTLFRPLLPFFLAASLASAQPTESLSKLQTQLNAHLDEARFAHAQWGVEVLALDSGKIIFQHNADKLMKPASNAKLYTAALALDRLGADYRIKTSFYAAAKPDSDGTVHGDLIVYGRGDPSFSARFNSSDYAKALQPAIEALQKAGIKRIEGDLVGDESFFHGPPYGSDWTWDDLQNYYGAPVSALTYQDNVIDLLFTPDSTVGAPCHITTMPATTFITFSNRTTTAEPNSRARIEIYRPLGKNVAYVSGSVPQGSPGHPDSVTVNDPALWFVTMLKETLAQNGITATGTPRQANWLDRETSPLDLSKLIEVASVQSPPLAEIVKQTLKPSQNLYAQLLLLQVGATSAESRPSPDATTEEAALAEMRKFLREAGIDRGATLLHDGSGLSRSSLVTPAATVKLLTFMSHHREKAAFTDALPIAGVDGTLRNRFKGTPAQGNVHAKTGSLGYVDTLSGYLTDAANEKLVFSIMLNNYSEPSLNQGGRAAIDDLVRMLVDYKP